MARYRVTCTQKHEKHGRIRSLGCYTPDNVFLKFTEAQVIDRIENHHDTFYVERPSGHVVDLEVVREPDGTKYVKTKADGEKPDNLGSLPDCPSNSGSGTLGGVGVAGGSSVVRAVPSHGEWDYPSVWL